jgi:hypothetical protein
MATREVKQLYKRFLQLHRNWPQQERRNFAFAGTLKKEIRRQFRETNDLEHAHRELRALEKLADDSWQVPETSTLKMYLPPKEQFALLDAEAQAYLSARKLSAFRYLLKYIGVI